MCDKCAVLQRQIIDLQAENHQLRQSLKHMAMDLHDTKLILAERDPKTSADEMERFK